jgi:hypothetical protein
MIIQAGFGTYVCLNCLEPKITENSERCKKCRGLGKHCSKETKKKIGLMNRGRHPSKETKEKMRQAHLGDRNVMKRPAVRAVHLEAVNRSEYREKSRLRWLGKHHSRETKEKMKRNNCMNRPEYRIFHSALCASPEYRKMMQQAHSTPEYHIRTSGVNAPNWRGGTSQEPYGTEFNTVLRRQIRDRDDHLCQFPNCYLPENSMKHAVHHIDYDKKNNVQRNLITLCKSHHMMTNHGDQSYWVEMFQEIQRLRGI